MDRSVYLDLAHHGLRMPIGTHLVLHEQEDPGAIELDGPRLGAIVAATAARFRTPLAVPLMDLKLEKEAILANRGIPPEAIDSHHFTSPPDPAPPGPPTPRIVATCGAIRTVASTPGLIPLGMGIGPFSLTTKLLADPITAVYLAGSGLRADDDPDVALLLTTLEVATATVLHYLALQIEAGAQALIVCEPAANQVYFSPKQLAENPTLFNLCVIDPMRKVRALLADAKVDLIFHDCGELTDDMVRQFASLDPAILSLGSSRTLWNDTALIPKTTVLYGNLPTKSFPSPRLTCDQVRAQSRHLLNHMRPTGHPFILGSECDVLSVPGLETAIMNKVMAFMDC